MSNYKKEITGVLSYDQNAEYIIGTFNLSKLLSKIYYSFTSNQINIRISDGCKILFNEDGMLYKRKSQYGTYDYFVSGSCLDDTLFDNCGKDLEVIIESKALGDTYEKTHISNEW